MPVAIGFAPGRRWCMIGLSEDENEPINRVIKRLEEWL